MKCLFSTVGETQETQVTGTIIPIYIMNTKNTNILQLYHATNLCSSVTIQRAHNYIYNFRIIYSFFTFDVMGIYMNHLDMQIYMSTHYEGVGNDNGTYWWLKLDLPLLSGALRIKRPPVWHTYWPSPWASYLPSQLTRLRGQCYQQGA